MKLKRLRVLMLSIGISLIFLSVVAARFRMSVSGNVYPQEYRTRSYPVTGDATLSISTWGNGSINFYVLDFEDSLNFIKTRDIGDVEPVLSLLNVSLYQGFLGVMPTGLYCFVVEAAMNTTVSFDVDMERTMPQWGFFFPGMLSITTVTGISVCEIIYDYVSEDSKSLLKK
ncbi:MAG: hypothetical protein GF309_09980 [Candidatus Lokiarchaeota archaeon]|nr:hypothetical protein [Candidatus Lokiarchaeota archaeon]